MKKKDARIFWVIAAVAVALFGGIWALYLYRLNTAIYEHYEKGYIQKGFAGYVSSIASYDDNPYKIVLSIKPEGDDREIVYGVTCVDKVFRDHVAIGDSVFKKPDELNINFCSKQKGCKGFRLNFCGEFD